MNSLPYEPLIRAARLLADDTNLSQASLARLVGTSNEAVSRWNVSGEVPWISADVAAIRLGLHPILVWGDDWLNVKGDYERLSRAVDAELAR